MTTKENAPAMTEAQGDTTAADSTRIEHLKTIAADHRGECGRIAPDLLAWLAILAAFALAGWLAEVAR